ncbi:MAG TPA: type I-C CRISPR-associated protein Cas7/Csd2, partial [Chthonomonadales bacterium]|nr:type I-C CRISPR-associated protein Cas7/Csd2 [Chthonomonadales bacterium]
FSLYGDPTRRHDFVFLFDVTDGNPNGDPDAGNMPRLDPETMQGLVSDVCIKRKVRDFVAVTKNDQPPYRIYVQDKGIYLNDLHAESHDVVGIPRERAKNPDRKKRDEARQWMCKNFYDVRMFGAVMSTGINAGQVRGPLQLTFSRSVDMIVPMDVAITRVALTDEKENTQAERAEDESERGSRTGTIGRKAVVPYGLYVGRGFFSAPFAAQTGVTREDLELFWRALMNMWDLDHSAARGLMACRGLYVFTHENGLGNAPAHALFDRIHVEKKNGVQAPRQFGDYVVSVDESNLPSGVTLTRLLG